LKGLCEKISSYKKIKEESESTIFQMLKEIINRIKFEVEEEKVTRKRV